MAEMTKPTAKKFPKLKAAWDEYGHAISWEELVDIKIYHYSTGGSYAALAWKHEDGMIEYADMECVGGVWDMNNDGGMPITEAQWLAARAKPECNWLEVPDQV